MGVSSVDAYPIFCLVVRQQRQNSLRYALFFVRWLQIHRHLHPRATNHQPSSSEEGTKESPVRLTDIDLVLCWTTLATAAAVAASEAAIAVAIALVDGMLFFVVVAFDKRQISHDSKNK